MADDAPILPRRQLTEILGLDKDASRAEIATTAPRLLSRLRERLESSEAAETEALQQEIRELESSCAHFATTSKPSVAAGERDRRNGLAGALLGASLTLALLVAYAAGFRISRLEDDDRSIVGAPLAELILDGKLPGATLRVLDADREELLIKVAAEGARLELASGRYALDVRREDCPDSWTRSVFFEESSTHRFEPQICQGTGQLTIRSNRAKDRLRIDGLDVGPTGEKPHLLGVGDHNIRVEKSGHEPFVAKVRIRPDESLELHADLMATSEATARGRPIPVTKTTPAAAPNGPQGLPPFDPQTLQQELRPGLENFGLSKRDLLPDRRQRIYAFGGGSTEWHDRVSADLVARYDTNGSGQIDNLQESEAISCEVWREIERDFDGGGLGLSMVRYYGFDGTEWHPNALGFARTHRSAAFEKMKECGLQSQPT
jgi:hypothetical protein